MCGRYRPKAAGWQTVARLLGLDRSEVMAVGDNYNDRDMLEWAGVGVVMGNASEEMRTAGYNVTGTNDECGAGPGHSSLRSVTPACSRFPPAAPLP